MLVHIALLLYILPVSLGKNVSTARDQKNLLSSSYIVQIEIATRHIIDVSEVSQRLTVLAEEALNAAAARHFRQSSLALASSSWANNITTEIIRIQEVKDKTWIAFVVYLNGAPLLGEVLAQDMALLSDSHISATLHYPFSRLLSQKQLADDSQNKWWIIGVICASGLLLVLIGWFILFVYYNSCGRETFLSHSFPKVIYIKDEETQSSPTADYSGNAPGATGDAPILSLPLESNKTGSDKEEIKEEIRTPSLDIPIQIITDNTKSMSLDSWVQDDDRKKFDFAAPEKKKKERPKAAGKRRPLRTTDGRIMGTLSNSSSWSEYVAADVVAKSFGIQPSISWVGPHEHPFPARPSIGGSVQYETPEQHKSSMHQVL